MKLKRIMPWVLMAGLALACAPTAPRPEAAATTAPVAKAAAPTAAAPATAAPPSKSEAAPAPAQATPADQCEPGKEHWRSPGPAKRGGVLTRAGTLSGLDPTRPVGAGDPGPQIYNTLVETRGCRYGDPVMAPSLARSWEISPDGLTYTLKLRDNVKWHNKPPVNGRPFTSADVAWSIEFHKSGTVVRSLWEGVSHEEPDPTTVVLRLQQPDADFLQKLGHYQNIMLAREVKDQHGDFSQVVVGTGAFMLQEYKPGQSASMVRNPDYWEMGDDGKPLPYVDEVRTVEFQDYNAEVAAFRGSQIDYTGTFGMLKLEADAVKGANPKLVMTQELQFTHAGIWFRLDKAPWNDVRVRKAVLLTLDREDLIASNRGGAVHSAFVPAAMTEYAWPEAKMIDKFKLNRDEAKKLLQEAGIAPNSINVTLKTASQFAEDAEVAQQHLAQIGIQTKVVVEGRNFTTIINGLNFDDLGWGVNPGQPNLNYWVGDFIRTGASFNSIKFSDPQVDQLAVAQSRELDPVKRKVITDQLQDRLFETVPYAPTISRIYYHFISCRIKNSALTKPNHNQASMKQAWIDPTGC
ncbi:MAG: ABC transporter substrate-binding protein [Chloroflexota bacterium]